MTTYRFIEAEKANHTVRMICRVLRVSPAAYYAWRDAQEAVGVDADALLRVHVPVACTEPAGAPTGARV